MSNSRTRQAVVLDGVGKRCAAQATLCEGRLALYPGNLPRRTVAQPQTRRDNVVPPNRKTPATVRVLVAADGLVMVVDDTVGPLSIPATSHG